MVINIRQESENDFKEIYDLVKIAFQTAKVSNEKEQDFVNQLRSSSAYISELALVAEENNKLVGHIMLTKNYIYTDAGKIETLLLGPVAVLLEYRNKGVGSKLITGSFDLAKEMGYKSAILAGDPSFYNRFGFKKSVDFGIKHEGIPEEYVMACELVPDGLSGISGTIDLLTPVV